MDGRDLAVLCAGLQLMVHMARAGGEAREGSAPAMQVRGVRAFE